MPRRLCIWLAAAALCGAPGAAAAAIPDARTGDPVQQGVLLSLGSIYRIEATVWVDALRTKSGRVFPLGPLHTVTELGTGFAVAPSGVVVTDAHVAAPSGAPLAVAAAPLALAQHGLFGEEAAYARWVDTNRARPVGVRVLALRVWRADAAPGRPAARVTAKVIPGSVEPGPDLALVQLSTRNVPALLLNEAETFGTPAAAIGYGIGTPTTLGIPTSHVPAVKTGTVGASGTSVAAPGQQLTLVNAPISRGDSGAPVVDAAAAVHGIVRFRTQTGGAMEQSQAIFDELARLHIANDNGAVFTGFATGLGDLRAGRYAAAAAAFGRVARLDPAHPLAAQFAHTASVQARNAHPVRRPRWWRPMFIGISALAVLGLLFGVRRLRALRQARRDAAGPDGFPAAR